MPPSICARMGCANPAGAESPALAADWWVARQHTAIVAACDYANGPALEVLQVEDTHIGQIALACALGYLDFRFGDMDWRHNRSHLATWFATFSTRAALQASIPQG